MKNANPDMLLRIAQGDAYAMAVEYVSHAEHPKLFEDALKFERYLKHPKHSLNPGCYTDDTQMSIAVAEVLCEERESAYDSNAFAASFFNCFERDPRDGYSRGFQAILEKAKSSEHMVAMLVPDSSKNGAAMRSVPLGAISDVRLMLDAARAQASVTHNTPGGIASSQAVALMSHFALHTDYGLDKMFDFVSSTCPSLKRSENRGAGAWASRGQIRAGSELGCVLHTQFTLFWRQEAR